MLIVQPDFPSSTRSERGNTVRPDESIKRGVALQRWRISKVWPRGNLLFPIQSENGRDTRLIDQNDSLLGIDRCVRGYRVALRGDRGPLFSSHVLHRVLRAFLQEESSHPRRNHCIRYVGCLTLEDNRIDYCEHVKINVRSSIPSHRFNYIA